MYNADEKANSFISEKIKTLFPKQVTEYECSVDGQDGKRMVLGNLDDFGKVNHTLLARLLFR